MVTARRVQRLRELIAQLESLPASPDRDRLLSEFRSRAVDLDTGVTPRAVLPMREPAAAPALGNRRPRNSAPGITPMAPAAPAPAVEYASPGPDANRSKSVNEPFREGDRLWLEDSMPAAPPPQVRKTGDRAVPAWTLGLRG
jgi:hypothetical protein